MRAPHPAGCRVRGGPDAREPQTKQGLLRELFVNDTSGRNSVFLLGYWGVRLDLTCQRTTTERRTRRAEVVGQVFLREETLFFLPRRRERSRRNELAWTQKGVLRTWVCDQGEIWVRARCELLRSWVRAGCELYWYWDTSYSAAVVRIANWMPTGKRHSKSGATKPILIWHGQGGESAAGKAKRGHIRGLKKRDADTEQGN